MSHFSECLYRKDSGQIRILGGNWHFRWWWFFQVGLENYLYKKYWIRISNKKMIPIVIFAISHFRSPTPTTFWKSVFVSLFSMVYTPPSPTYFFVRGKGVGGKKFFRVFIARGWEIFKFLGDLLYWEDLI